MPAKTRNLRDGTLSIKDASGTPNVLLIPIMDGDLKFTVNRPSFTVKNRGKIDHRKDGDEMEMDVSFSFKFEQWQNANGNTGISPADALQGIGGAAAWVNTDPSCGSWAIDLVFEVKDPCAPTSKETLTFSKFHADKLDFSEGAETNTVSISGKALAQVPTRAYA